MGYTVGFVELRQCFLKGGERGDLDFGEDSSPTLLVLYPNCHGRSAHSASNWLGRIRSASRSKFL